MKARIAQLAFTPSAILLSSLLASALVSATAHAQTASGQVADGGDEVVRVETNLVMVPASVTDRDGRYVSNLRREDFLLFEDGAEQQIAFFAPAERPFTILFLLDTSGSMAGRMGELALAANAFLDQLRPDDRMMAASFAETVRLLHGAIPVRELRGGNRFDELRPGGNTLLYGAVDDALRRMKKVSGRKAVVLFSDGYNWGTLEREHHANDSGAANRTLRAAEEQGALIYTVQYRLVFGAGSRDAEARYQFATDYMRGLAEKTGGRHYQVEELSDLGGTFGKVAEELRRQYSLGYYPKRAPEAGQPRRIKVRVRPPGLAVQARDIYVAEPSKRP